MVATHQRKEAMTHHIEVENINTVVLIRASITQWIIILYNKRSQSFIGGV
jgi:hypothetical protein